MLEARDVSDSVQGDSDSEHELALLSCPRCGLTIAPRARWLAVEHCPRCVARGRKLVNLRPSAGP